MGAIYIPLCNGVDFLLAKHQGYNGPLLFFQDALRIQSIFDCCPLLRTLGYDVLRMKGLLSADKLRHAEEDEIIIPRSDRKVLIFFSGTITVENEKTTTYRLEANRADFRPYISGRSLVKRIFKVIFHGFSHVLLKPLPK
ncbi:hypothetical protein COOONC_15160 [Cooperia oncophora]